MKIAPFRIERYYAVHEFTAPYMLSSSDAESVAVADLLALEPDASERLGALRLGYTESPGAPELREAIAAMYTTTEPDDVVVVSAAEEGIFLAYHALLEPGDHVVVETPCYESALQVPRSAGADVTAWRRSAADGWAHDLDALEQALRPDTKLVYVNTPHNPTGTSMPREVLDRVVELCAERGAWLFCDEVYRELEHDPGDPPAGRLRPLRARALARLRLEDLRPAGPPARLARLARARRSRPDRRPQALHDDLCERPERAPLRRRAPAPRHARGAEPRHRAHEPAASRRLPRASGRALLVDATECEPDRLRPRARASTTRRASARRSSPRPASCSSPAPSTTSRSTSGSATGGRTCPTCWPGWNRGSTRVLNGTGRVFTTDPQGFRTSCRYTFLQTTKHPQEGRLQMGDAQRLTTWIDWYRFARRALELDHAEASEYATARYVEEQNRECREEEGSGMSAVETQSDDLAEESRPGPGGQGARLADRAAASRPASTATPPSCSRSTATSTCTRRPSSSPAAARLRRPSAS